MQTVAFNGWKNTVRLNNDDVELMITTDVGPRIMRFAYIGEKNVFAELPGQQGGTGESEWVLRGGHRLWAAPEAKPRTYELDNDPVETREIPGGVETLQAVGPLSGLSKTMSIRLDADRNRVELQHTLRNDGQAAVSCAPWALSVMSPGGTALIPLPKTIPHTERLTHNQEWSLWGYTDLSDDRWTLTPSYLFFRQDPARGPNKLGIAHREGWVAYMLDPFLFVKRFVFIDGALYPDGGVNFETFSNEDFLEIESLAPMVCLEPGATVDHREAWWLFKDVPLCRTPDEVEQHVVPRIKETEADVSVSRT